MTNNNFNRK